MTIQAHKFKSKEEFARSFIILEELYGRIASQLQIDRAWDILQRVVAREA